MAHQSITVPLIEWGSLALLLGIVLSPFLIIRISVFRPTRWWHIVGAYIISFTLIVSVFMFFDSINQWLIKNYFNSVELADAYGDGFARQIPALILAYPLLVFYSSWVLYGSFTRKQFYATLLVAIVFSIVTIRIVIYLMAVALGQLVNYL